MLSHSLFREIQNGDLAQDLNRDSVFLTPCHICIQIYENCN